MACRLPIRHTRINRTVVRAASTTSKPPPQATEAEALAAYSAANTAGLEPCLALLRRAATDKSIAPQLVEGALAYLEQNHAQPASDIDATYRLVFSTSTSNRAFQYIPVQEDFVIDLVKQYCALQSVVGPFSFDINGAISAWNPATGELSFQFTAVDFLLFGKQIFQVKPKTKAKTYTFFRQEGNIAAARSSAGGLTLLRR